MLHSYVGARYVPRFLGTYDATTQYDALDVVDNGSGTSYIARKTTPAGTPLTDNEFWFIYGASSGAIIALQNQVNALSSDVDDVKNQMIHETMQDIIAISSDLSDGMIVQTSGFYLINDGGSGTYLITSAIRSDAYCVDIGNGLYAALLDDYSDVNAVSCGLKANTTTQAEAETNSDILNDLITVIYTVHPEIYMTNGKYRGGGSIYIPAGDYKIGKALTSIDGKLNFEIHGECTGHTRIQPWTYPSTLSFIETTGTFSKTMALRVHDLIIAGFVDGINIINGTACEIYNCLFEGCDNAISLDSFVQMNIHDNKIINGKRGLNIYASNSNSTTLYCERNYIANCSVACIRIESTNNHGFRTFYFTENVLEYTPYGIQAISDAAYSRIYVQNNHIEQCGTFAIAIDGCGLILRDNDIDTNIAIYNPAGELVDLDHFDGVVGGIAYNNALLPVKWYKNNGEYGDTILRKFCKNSNSVTLGSYPHLPGGNVNRVKIKYSSSNGFYQAIGTWNDGIAAFTAIAGTVVSDGISAPSTNLYGTVAFNDTGSDQRFEVECM